MTRLSFCLALTLLGGFADQAVAQDKKENKWTGNSPTTSKFATKTIDCVGKITLDGYKVKKVVLIYWEDKKKEKEVDITAKVAGDGSWTFGLPVPKGSTPYNVRCEAILESGGVATPAYKTQMRKATSSAEKL